MPSIKIPRGSVIAARRRRKSAGRLSVHKVVVEKESEPMVKVVFFPPLGKRLGLTESMMQNVMQEHKLEPGDTLRIVLRRLAYEVPTFGDIVLDPQTGMVRQQGVWMGLNGGDVDQRAYDSLLADGAQISFLPA